MLARPRSAARLLAPLAALAALALIPPAASAQAQERSVLVALLHPPAELVGEQADGPEPAFDWALAVLDARPALSLGVSSAVQGVYDRQQAYLDMTQGTRVSLSAYDPREPPPLLLRPAPGGSGALLGWPAVRRRAQSAPADVLPGLLAQTVPGGAGYAGIAGGAGGAAILAADRAGLIAGLSLGSALDVPQRARALLARHALVVAALPPGERGVAALDRLIEGRRAGELLLAMQAPPPGDSAQLLPLGALGLGGTPGGRLSSPTTHVEGVVAGIDIAPTVLEHLGLPVPRAMKGRPLRSEPGRDAAALSELVERLRVVLPRRLPALWTLIGSWTALLLVAMLVADRRGQRWAMRAGALAVLWLPSVLLATAVLRPSHTLELLLVAVLALAAGALTDRLVAWPRGPAVPALTGLALYALDLAFGSPLVIRSLLGPNPLFGARFYGIGNELEATLTALLLAGVGALLAGRGRSRGAVAAFAGGGLALALLIGAGRLGADVGGVITVGAGAGVAAVLMLPGGLTRRAAAAVVAAPLAGLALLALVDLATGGDSHFTRSVLRAEGSGDVWDIVARRYELAGRQAVRGMMPAVTLIALLAIALGVRRRERLLAPVESDPAWRALLAGLVAAGFAGALFNDSGPVLLLFETFIAACLVLYLRGDRRLAQGGTRSPASARPQESTGDRQQPAAIGGESAKWPRTRPPRSLG